MKTKLDISNKKHKVLKKRKFWHFRSKTNAKYQYLKSKWKQIQYKKFPTFNSTYFRWIRGAIMNINWAKAVQNLLASFLEFFLYSTLIKILHWTKISYVKIGYEKKRKRKATLNENFTCKNWVLLQFRGPLWKINKKLKVGIVYCPNWLNNHFTG
jgi:hypothetical protein